MKRKPLSTSGRVRDTPTLFEATIKKLARLTASCYDGNILNGNMFQRKGGHETPLKQQRTLCIIYIYLPYMLYARVVYGNENIHEDDQQMFK